MTLPIIETQPGSAVSLDEMPEDPGAALSHLVCSACYPNPRPGDKVRTDCGYIDRSFGGFPKRRRWRRPEPTCLPCLRVFNGVAQPICGCRDVRR